MHHLAGQYGDTLQRFRGDPFEAVSASDGACYNPYLSY
jgi:hypothetical protein